MRKEKNTKALLLMLLCLALASCQGMDLPAAVSPEQSPNSTPEPPSVSASEPPAQSPAQEFPMVWTDEQWLAEEYHTAFPVGDFWVTAEGRELIEESDFEVTLTVWNPEQMDAPLQTMTKATQPSVFGLYDVVDANFDGDLDFGWMYMMGNQPTYWYYWIWDMETGMFVEEPVFSNISSPSFDSEAQTISGWARSSAASTGLSTIYQWIDGELTCMRSITVENQEIAHWEYQFVMTVEDRLGGAFVEVYHAEYPEDAADYINERGTWENLDYKGEPDGFYQDFLEKFQNTPCRGFLVDTHGTLGQLLVTVEQAAGAETASFKVWNPKDLAEPVQTFSATAMEFQRDYLGWQWVRDFNFDGRDDFGYGFLPAEYGYGYPKYYHVWIWDEDAKQFVLEPEFDRFSFFFPHYFTKDENWIETIWADIEGEDTTVYYQWIDGVLTRVEEPT